MTIRVCFHSCQNLVGGCPSNPDSDSPDSLLWTRHSWWATGWNWAWGSSWRQIMDWLVSMATCCLHKRQPVSRYARKFQHIYTRKNSCMKSFMKLQKKRENIFAHMTTNRQTRLAINGLIEDTEQCFEQTKKITHGRFVRSLHFWFRLVVCL